MTASHIAENHVVSIEFELHDTEGALVDSSHESGPLSYLHGQGQILPGLERALDGKPVGHEARIEVTPDDGFGPRDEQLMFKVPRDRFDFEPSVGQVLQAENPSGMSAPFQVVAVEADGVTLDGNHPMAGKHLVFDVKVVSLREASAEELEHGHAHDEHGHSHDGDHQH